MGDWRWRARKLADQLVAGGAIMDPAWGEAFAATPRHVFVPRFFDGDQEIKDDAGDRWLDAVYADVTLLTDRLPAAGYDGTLPTSSSSRPRIMAIMLDRLDVHPGMRVLEIGTGTGYNAALLCHRLGDGGVATVDLDPDLTNSAAVRLGKLGYHPTIVAADGAEGLPATAPYDRILATCAITHIPPEWIRQLTDGGRIVAPFAGGAGALAVLTKTAPDEVTGRIDSEPALFMPLRPRIDDPLGPGESIADAWHGMAHYGTTRIPAALLAEAGPDLLFWLQLHRPGLRVGTPDRDGIVVHTADAMAQVAATPVDGRWPVTQRGPCRIWDTIESAVATWELLDRPERSRLGISALDDLDRQYVWLDNPDGVYSWPLPL